MKYLALLRGINVGGNSLIKMVDLKEAVEKSGFKNVSTYIQSGNVIFESEEKDTETITTKLEDNIKKIFHYNVRVIIKSDKQLAKIVSDIPVEWGKGEDLRRYIAFIKEPLTPNDLLKEMQLREGIDSAKVGQGIVYMSTKLSGITKSGFSKLANKKIYQSLTIRNYNTTKKILELMQ